jgi:hypothetical protein
VWLGLALRLPLCTEMLRKAHVLRLTGIHHICVAVQHHFLLFHNFNFYTLLFLYLGMKENNI